MSFCPNCGFDNKPGARFCGRCGAVLPEESIPKGNPYKMRKDTGRRAADKSQELVAYKWASIILLGISFLTSLFGFWFRLSDTLTSLISLSNGFGGYSSYLSADLQGIVDSLSSGGLRLRQVAKLFSVFGELISYYGESSLNQFRIFSVFMNVLIIAVFVCIPIEIVLHILNMKFNYLAFSLYTAVFGISFAMMTIMNILIRENINSDDVFISLISMSFWAYFAFAALLIETMLWNKVERLQIKIQTEQIRQI